MTLSKGEIYAADVVRRLLSSITLITCLLISLAIIVFQKYKFPQSRLVLWYGRDHSLHSLPFTLLLELYLLEFAGSLLSRSFKPLLT